MTISLVADAQQSSVCYVAMLGKRATVLGLTTP